MIADGIDFDQMIRQAQGEQARTSSRGRIQVTDGVIPIFHKREIKDKAASDAAGRVVNKQVDFIEIIVPGQRDRVIGPVRQDHKDRFPEQWEAYERGDTETIVGTPVTEWQGVSRLRASELRANQVYTVEQLADLPDGVAHRIGPDFQALKAAARQFLSGRSELDVLRVDMAKALQARAEKDAELDELKAQLARLQERLGDAPIRDVTLDAARADLAALDQENAERDVEADELRENLKGASNAVDGKGRSAGRR